MERQALIIKNIKYKKGGEKTMKLVHKRTVYTEKTPSGAWSTAKKNVEVTEEEVTLEFFKKFTSDETIAFFNSRVTRSYEKVGYVPTKLVGYSPDGSIKTVDEFIF